MSQVAFSVALFYSVVLDKSDSTRSFAVGINRIVARLLCAVREISWRKPESLFWVGLWFGYLEDAFGAPGGAEKWHIPFEKAVKLENLSAISGLLTMVDRLTLLRMERANFDGAVDDNALRDECEQLRRGVKAACLEPATDCASNTYAAAMFGLNLGRVAALYGTSPDFIERDFISINWFAGGYDLAKRFFECKTV